MNRNRLENMLPVLKHVLQQRMTVRIYIDDDSMKDAGFQPNCELEVLLSSFAGNGDIVVAVHNGTLIALAYHTDNEGKGWLVSCNDKEPLIFPADGDSGIEILGKVIRYSLRSPRVATELLRQRIDAGKELPGRHLPSKEKVGGVLQSIAHMIGIKRHWYAVYRAFADNGIVEEGMYETFTQLVYSMVPQPAIMPDATTLRRMAIDCFARPVSQWSMERAPFGGKRYELYHSIAVKTTELIKKITCSHWGMPDFTCHEKYLHRNYA
ncbi:MAG: hypothetical protein IKU79_00125 [Bacteroidaceae bacterium]|nr:hypothetical protein [Bacteroidaceae bacterium]